MSGKFVEKHYLKLFMLVTALFFMWGIPNNINGILITQFMKSFELTVFQASLIQSAFFMGYFIFAIPAAMVIKRYSYKTGLIGGLLLFAVGCLMFYPAAQAASYTFFLIALFVIASGLAFLETGANPFIVQLGDESSAEQRLNMAQAFNPIGAISGVLLGTIFIFSGVELTPDTISAMKETREYDSFQEAETMRVVVPYLVLALFAIVWAVLLYKTKFPEFSTKDESEQESVSFKKLLSIRSFTKGVIAQFLYVGAQVGIWSYFIIYVQQYVGGSEKLAGYMLSGTLLSFTIGRFFATWFMKYISPGMLMGIFSTVNIFLVAVTMLCPGLVGMWAMFATSFFMSLMYPTIFALSIKKAGSQSKIAGSVLVMAIVGGAAMPPLMGVVSDVMGSLAISMILPLISFVYITYYSFSEK